MGFFIRKGSGAKVLIAASVAGASPTRTEITNALDISDQLIGVTGFSINSTRVPVPVLKFRRTPQIGGEDQIADSSLNFADMDDIHTIREAMPKDEEFVVLLFPYGDVPGERMEVWPAISLGPTDNWDFGNTPAAFAVPLAITEDPNTDAVIPAL